VRTEYEVYHRPRHDDDAADDAGRFASAAEAMAATGFPDVADWSATRSGALLCTATPGRTQEWMILEAEVAETDTERVEQAINMALDWGATDGAHHKQWALDQVVRILAGDRYEQVITDWCAGPDGPYMYSWDTGIAP
jgi:hypothetical protein